MAVVEKIKETRTFVEECWVELQKVTWPDFEQLRSATVVVVLFTIVISVIIWFMDKTTGWIVGLIMGVFGA
ncbi:MAG: preprotein translocase subunit SecE [Gemmatimonadetes bacterium]|jgi:preprotein translocase subunit SecE|nr:preprotein translocase subunit SecE [Gemmatimonadota bacterium]